MASQVDVIVFVLTLL